MAHITEIHEEKTLLVGGIQPQKVRSKETKIGAYHSQKQGKEINQTCIIPPTIRKQG
jgi:hypothetical protein